MKHAKELDRQNNNIIWMDALAKEMYNIRVALKVIDKGQSAPNSWKKVTWHLVWDVKMDFTRKARWVLDGNNMPDPVASLLPGWCPKKAGRLLSPMLHSTDYTSLQQT